MKTILIIMTSLFMAVQTHAQEKPKTLDDFLDERIARNLVLRDRFMKEAKGSRIEEDLQPFEKKIGDEWAKYLKFVRESKDNKLKAYVVYLDLLEEVRGAYYDLEVADGLIQELTVKAELHKWKKKLKSLKKLVEQGAASDVIPFAAP